MNYKAMLNYTKTLISIRNTSFFKFPEDQAWCCLHHHIDVKQ